MCHAGVCIKRKGRTGKEGQDNCTHEVRLQADRRTAEQRAVLLTGPDAKDTPSSLSLMKDVKFSA